MLPVAYPTPDCPATEINKTTVRQLGEAYEVAALIERKHFRDGVARFRRDIQQNRVRVAGHEFPVTRILSGNAIVTTG